MGQVRGKVAIVTGGASGIGAACAITSAREGAKVIVTGDGQAQDFANGALFLASSYTTEAELVIDGGMTTGARPRWELTRFPR
jgi:NAD(P)-dependent dehydrogenase (short-subunit alcohol dehydrogenase family)